jgi:hypothetical protein
LLAAKSARRSHGLQVNLELIVCLGNGDGSFSAGSRIKILDFPNGMSTLDFNGDGRQVR